MSDTTIRDWLSTHNNVGVICVGLWAFVGLCLIARLWTLHRRDRIISKVVWSIILLLPIFGWLFFAAFYRPPDALSWTNRAEYGSDAGSVGSGDH